MNTGQAPVTPVRPDPDAETISVASDVDYEQAVAFCLKCLQPIYPDQGYERIRAVRPHAFGLTRRIHPGYDAFIHDDCGAPGRAGR